MIFFHQKQDPGNNQLPSDEVLENIHVSPEEFHITDGGEFLDDALRMKEQPFAGKEVNEEE